MSQVTRRLFLKYVAAAGVAGAGVAITGLDRSSQALARVDPPPPVMAHSSVKHRRHGPRKPEGHAVPGGTLDPLRIPKYEMPLFIPPAMPLARGKQPDKAVDYYEISVEQILQQVLPPSMGLPQTTLLAYGPYGQRGIHSSPAATIEAQFDRPVRVKWINNLVDPATGQYLSHFLAVDQTLHWANPPGPRDSRGTDPTPYKGPVPVVTHLHGSHVGDESDGYPEAWFLPDATDIPAGYAREGSWYGLFKAKAKNKFGVEWTPGSATFQYPNDQDATTLWYHDHTLGMTRLNIYAGLAGFYVVNGGPADAVGGVLPGPAPSENNGKGARLYDVPFIIQDRSFNADGSLFFPSDRAFFEGLSKDQLKIPFIPETACDGQPSDISPIWNPEFFGNTMMVNGRTWPYLEVEPRRYRFRLLNGCNARFLLLRMSDGRPFYRIAAAGGFLPAPVQLTELLLAPAERADVIIDFAGLSEGAALELLNVGPDEPFGGDEFEPADPDTTGKVMQFRVGKLRGQDKSSPPMSLVLPAQVGLGAATTTRRVSLNEVSSASVRVLGGEEGGGGPIVEACDSEDAEPFGPQAGLLGTVDIGSGGAPMGMPMMWSDAVTENPAPGSTETWEIYNFTEDAHPIHIHQVMFQVVSRQPFDMETGELGEEKGPEPSERGRTDTVVAYPGQITRIKAKFDLEGQYVWHCHIIDHEDNEMMRPMAVGAPQTPG